MNKAMSQGKAILQILQLLPMVPMVKVASSSKKWGGKHNLDNFEHCNKCHHHKMEVQSKLMMVSLMVATGTLQQEILSQRCRQL
jgi:hypothetical protein